MGRRTEREGNRRTFVGKRLVRDLERVHERLAERLPPVLGGGNLVDTEKGREGGGGGEARISKIPTSGRMSATNSEFILFHWFAVGLCRCEAQR